MSEFKLTVKQKAAQAVFASLAVFILLVGGSRSGKTFLIIRNLVLRALKAPNSRHAIFRLRFNSIKASVVLDTFPKVMRIAFPKVEYKLDKTDWYATFPNGSQLWFGGLDDKERTEKILGMEFVTMAFNECSQIKWASIQLALTRLAQNVTQKIGDKETVLKPKAYFDENPPTKAHWSYRLFIQKVDPETKKDLSNPEEYGYFFIQPKDNQDNISESYIKTLEGMSGRMRRRFLEGQFGDAIAGALFSMEDIEAYRVIDSEDLPDMVRVVVAVDPSGSDDVDNADNDEIGIVTAGLGTDGNAYILEDSTVKAGPATWGKVATTAFERHDADSIVGETNFGGAMVKHVLQTARPRTPFTKVTASRGKVQRAEPFSSLYEQGKVRHVGRHNALEEELASFTTHGYVGGDSPNRADAAIWALAALFPAIVTPKKENKGYGMMPSKGVKW